MPQKSVPLHREKRKRDFTGKMWRIPPPPPLSNIGTASSFHRNTNKLEERQGTNDHTAKIDISNLLYPTEQR